MAISKAPRCEIRCLVMHIYPDGIKAYGHERITQPIGRCGKPIKKLRYMAHGPRPGPGPQAAGHTWHHGVGDLRHWPQPAGQSRPAFIDDASKGSNRQQKGAPFKSALDLIT
ncbi:hypothetical protein LBMAG41_25740 [Cyanobium sp.]|nr:hypothetical protein LBMAG41_25740 [Cyanobium sp.]